MRRGLKVKKGEGFMAFVSITRLATHQYLVYNYAMRRDAVTRYG